MTHSPARVLLLGGTGFVGRHVCEKLTRMGCSMTVITRRASQASAVKNLPRVHDRVLRSCVGIFSSFGGGLTCSLTERQVLA